jgi:hypothetical protein
MGTSKKLKTHNTILLVVSLGLLVLSALLALLRENSGAASLAAVGAACLVITLAGLAKK